MYRRVEASPGSGDSVASLQPAPRSNSFIASRRSGLMLFTLKQAQSPFRRATYNRAATLRPRYFQFDMQRISRQTRTRTLRPFDQRCATLQRLVQSQLLDLRLVLDAI